MINRLNMAFFYNKKGFKLGEILLYMLIAIALILLMYIMVTEAAEKLLK